MEPLDVLILFFYLECLSTHKAREIVANRAPVVDQFLKERSLYLQKSQTASQWGPYLHILPTKFTTPIAEYKLYEQGAAEVVNALVEQLPEPGPEILQKQLDEYRLCYGKVDSQ